MDEVKFGEILLPGDEDTQSRREKTVRQKFWPTFRRAVRQIPFSRDVVAGFYCALDPQTPTKVRGVLLAALAYFVMPVDIIPDIFAVIFALAMTVIPASPAGTRISNAPASTPPKPARIFAGLRAGRNGRIVALAHIVLAYGRSSLAPIDRRYSPRSQTSISPASRLSQAK